MGVLIIFNLIVLIAAVSGSSPNKIFGGDRVEIYYYPFQVSVQIRNYHICGGAIISIHHVISAASCALHSDNVFYGNIQIISGTNDLEGRSVYSKIHSVAFVIFHPQYNQRNNWINDIAIFKLSSPIEFHHFCHRIKIGTVLPQGNRFTAIGWGINQLTSIMSRYLQKLKVKSLYPPACRQLYTHPAYELLQNSQHCLLPLSPTSRLTMGNSGSPVIIAKRMIGIISSLQVTDDMRPAIYTRVHFYTRWIEQTVDF